MTRGRRADAPIVLLVEDEPNMWLKIFRVLETAGYAVWRAADLSEALKVLNVLPVQLVLSKAALPRGDASTLLTAIRRQPRHATLPVVLMSAPGDVRGDVDAPTFVARPGETGRLLDMVRSQLGRSEDPAEPAAI
jgi:DNA-binding response OmpR family regulator